MSNSYAMIEQQSDTEWKFARTKLWMSYFEESATLPPPFNIFPTVKNFVKLCRRKSKRDFKRESTIVSWNINIDSVLQKQCLKWCLVVGFGRGLIYVLAFRGSLIFVESHLHTNLKLSVVFRGKKRRKEQTVTPMSCGHLYGDTFRQCSVKLTTDQ